MNGERHEPRVTRAEMQAAAALLDPDVATEILSRARVSRNVAMRALGLIPSMGSAHESFRKILDANPRLPHRLPGETNLHFRTDVICEMLLTTNGHAKT